MLILAILAAAAVPAGATFPCTPVSVWDGDGPIGCAEGPKIRLQGIAARELSGACRRGQPCPQASGIQARDTLVTLLGGPRGQSRDGHILVRGPTLSCRSAGPDRYRRTVARCTAPGTGDIGAALVGAGVAVRWATFG